MNGGFYFAMPKIEDGYICLARKIQTSDIWSKPSDWLKIWIYILQEVNHTDNKMYSKGENFFNYRDISRDCGVKYNSITKFVKWAKLATLVATQKTTRGIVIKVLKYDEYQNTQNYKSDTKSDTSGKLKAKQKQHKSYTINNNNKNTKNIKKISTNVDMAPRASYGDPVINEMHRLLMEGLGVSGLDGTQQENRYACSNLKKKIAKEFESRAGRVPSDGELSEFFREVLSSASAFHLKNMTNFRYINKHLFSILASKKGEQEQERKEGYWKCRYGHWHPKGQQCGHVDY